MKIDFDKINEIRKSNKISIANLCKLIDITPMTYWHWQKGNIEPTEKRVRDIATALEVNIEEISDLPPLPSKSEIDLKGNVESWLLLGGKKENKRLHEHNTLIKLLQKQQEELRQASVLVKALLSSIDSVCYVKDANLNYLIVNDAFLRLTSFQSHNVNNCDDYYFFPKNEAKSNTEQDLNVITTGEAILAKESIMPGTRRKKWCLTYKHPVLDLQGNVAGIIGIFIDITERLEYERINKLLKYAIDNCDDAFFLMDENVSKYNYISKSAMKLYGYTNEVFYTNINFWIKNCVHPAHIEKEKQYILYKNWPERYLCRIIDSSGKIKWIEKRHFHGKGYYLIIERDVTESIKNESINQFLKECIDDFNDAVAIMDLEDANYVYVNKGIISLYGYPAEAFYNDKTIWLEKCVHKDYYQSAKKYIENRSWPKEIHTLKIITSTGEEKWIQSRCISDGKYALFINVDITHKLKNDLRNELIHDALKESHALLIAINRKNWVLDNHREKSLLTFQKNFSKNVIFLNDAFESIYKYPNKAILSKDVFMFWFDKCIHPDDREKEIEYWKNASWPEIRQFRIIRSDGEIRHIRSRIIKGIADYDFAIEVDITNTLKDNFLRIAKKLKKYNISDKVINEVIKL